MDDITENYGIVGLQAKHSEWVASLKASDDVASIVALAVLDDFAPLIFPDCQHDWRTFEDEAVKTSGDQEWTCALCGETRIVNPPVKAVQDDDDCSHCAPTAMSAVGDSPAVVSEPPTTPAAGRTPDPRVFDRDAYMAGLKFPEPSDMPTWPDWLLMAHAANSLAWPEHRELINELRDRSQHGERAHRQYRDLLGGAK